MTMDKHRVTCGPLGKGTPGSRLKAAWKNSDMGKRPLRRYAAVVADDQEHSMHLDALEWLESK